MPEATRTPEVTVVPANEATWDDLQTVVGTTGDASRCWCQRFKMAPGESWASVGASGLALRLRRQTHCGDPSADTTTGLVAYVGGEPAGWCAVEPRPAYPRMLRNNRVPWEGRDEDKLDDSVWAVTCFVVRRGFRRRGIGSALAVAAVDFARRRGARAVEAYPMTMKEALASELNVGTYGMFVEAGFTEVGRPSIRRAVMRIDF